MQKYYVFYVSDSTAITAKALGKSLLSQFKSAQFVEELRPYVDSKEKASALAQEIKECQKKSSQLPIVFLSIMDENLKVLLKNEVTPVIDIFEPFTQTLEKIISLKSSKEVGQAHKVSNDHSYKQRIEAIDFTLATDDGLRTHDYDHADIILLGVSRSGKTPTAIYLALQLGLKVANFPFTSEDLPFFSLNADKKRNRKKLFGLLISEQRLISIRNDRRPNTNYASPQQVRTELLALKSLFQRENIPYVDTSTRSVEEIAASVVASLNSKKTD